MTQTLIHRNSKMEGTNTPPHIHTHRLHRNFMMEGTDHTHTCKLYDDLHKSTVAHAYTHRHTNVFF